jgi:hypothetical protein
VSENTVALVFNSASTWKQNDIHRLRFPASDLDPSGIKRMDAVTQHLILFPLCRVKYRENLLKTMLSFFLILFWAIAE